jgi:hypothetical protein
MGTDRVAATSAAASDVSMCDLQESRRTIRRRTMPGARGREGSGYGCLPRVRVATRKGKARADRVARAMHDG